MNGVKDALLNFPSEEHIVKVCKEGQKEKTCRYLVVGDKYCCEKFGRLKDLLDENVKENKMKNKGDNCGGILDILIKNQKELVDKKVYYEEAIPRIELFGSFIRFRIRKYSGSEILGIIWKEKGKNKEEAISNLSVEALEITLSPSDITLGARGMGVYAGITTIYF